jgi:hypothetical protein
MKGDVFSMRGPIFGMIPARAAGMRIPGRVHAVLDVIANHTRNGSAYLCRDTIAGEARIDPSKVSYCTRWLREHGLLRIDGKGGRGLANVYRIIYDEPAAVNTTGAENGAVDGTVSNQNGADFGSKTVPIVAQNGATFGQNGADFGTPTEEEQKEITNPPYGGVARAREGSFSVDEEDGTSQSNGVNRQTARQPSLLLPIAGTLAGDAQRGASAFEDWQPVTEQSDDRRRQAEACTIQEFIPTKQEFEAYVRQGRADGWLASRGDAVAAANREFDEFREWAKDPGNNVKPRSPAKWSRAWRKWLTHVAGNDQRRGARRANRSIAGAFGRAAARPRAGRPPRDP